MSANFHKLILVTHRQHIPLKNYLRFIKQSAMAGITCVQLIEKESTQCLASCKGVSLSIIFILLTISIHPQEKKMSKEFTTLMLNWYANPYQAPIFVAKALGFYEEVGLNLAILQPTDPSDVTKIVGHNKVDIGLKAMIHTIAGRARGYPITSIGTLLDEPPTGLISLKSAGIHSLSDIQGKRIGYIGEFGKQIIDNLAQHAGIEPMTYTTVRVGMYMVDAIQKNIIDAGIGFSNFHQVELESIGETSILRIDELAGLGCCCFCSIQIIANERTLQDKPETLKAFLTATQKGASYVTQFPEAAFEKLYQSQLKLKSELQQKIFTYSLPYFTRSLLNVDRDWKKVHQYTQQLGLHNGDLELAQCYTNKFIES